MPRSSLHTSDSMAHDDSTICPKFSTVSEFVWPMDSKGDSKTADSISNHMAHDKLNGLEMSAVTEFLLPMSSEGVKSCSTTTDSTLISRTSDMHMMTVLMVQSAVQFWNSRVPYLLKATNHPVRLGCFTSISIKCFFFQE